MTRQQWIALILIVLIVIILIVVGIFIWQRSRAMNMLVNAAANVTPVVVNPLTPVGPGPIIVGKANNTASKKVGSTAPTYRQILGKKA